MASLPSEKLERVCNQDLNIRASLTFLQKKRCQDLPDFKYLVLFMVRVVRFKNLCISHEEYCLGVT